MLCEITPPPHLETVRCPFALYTFIVMHFSHAESSLVMSDEGKYCYCQKYKYYE